MTRTGQRTLNVQLRTSQRGWLRRWTTAVCIAGWAPLWGWLSLAAEPPQLDSLFPAGGQQGSSVLVKAGGKLDPWPTEVWADDPGIVFKPSSTNGQFQVEIAATATAGPHLVRAYTAFGASAPRLFVVGADAEIVWDPMAAATNKIEAVAPIPVTFNGWLQEPGTVDRCLLEVPSNRLLRARLVTRGLDSPLPAMLVLLDNESVPIVSTRDPSARSSELTCPILHGGVYRLHVVAATNAAVPGVASLPTAAPLYRLMVNSEAWEPPPPASPFEPRPLPPDVIRPHTFVKTLVMPSTFQGVVTPPGRQVLYRFNAGLGERFTFRVNAGSVGSPLEPLLSILNTERSVVAESLPAPDAELVWMAPVAGEYILGVSDRRGKGGPIFAYQLEVGKPKAHFTAGLSDHAFRVKPGQTVEVPVTIVRPSYSDAVLTVSVLGLPPGVRATLMHAPPDLEQVKVRISADADAGPANAPFRVVVMTTAEVPPQSEVARFTVPRQHAGPGELLINDSDQAWLTVLP